MLIDMEVSSAPGTQQGSPDQTSQTLPPVPEERFNEETDLIARKAGMGSLMKSAKQDVKVQEFDMSAFGF